MGLAQSGQKARPDPDALVTPMRFNLPEKCTVLRRVPLEFLFLALASGRGELAVYRLLICASRRAMRDLSAERRFFWSARSRSMSLSTAATVLALSGSPTIVRMW